jgi:hypothetical protein
MHGKMGTEFCAPMSLRDVKRTIHCRENTGTCATLVTLAVRRPDVDTLPPSIDYDSIDDE